MIFIALSLYTLLKSMTSKTGFKIILTSALFLILGLGFMAKTEANSYPILCKGGNPQICAELSAKQYLLKHEPSKGGGMPQVAPWKTAAERRKHEHMIVAQAIKETPEIAQWFLRQKYTGTRAQDTKLYLTVYRLSHINLTKTDQGFDYSFKTGSICTEHHYSGSLTMDEQEVVADQMKMEKKIVPC